MLDFPDNETTMFWVGTKEGNMYQANRYDHAGAKAGLNQQDIYKGHAGHVMRLCFHPLAGPVDFSDLFLAVSVDQMVKLWRAKSLAKPSTTACTIPPVYSFDEVDNYVYDAKWHLVHPTVFGTADGLGRFDSWNSNNDMEVSTVTTNVGTGHAINKLEWDRKDSWCAALGCSDGKLYTYDIGDIVMPGESEWTGLQKTSFGDGTEVSSSHSTSSTSTPKPAYSTVQLSLGAPLPTHSDVATVCTTSGTLQVPSVVLPTSSDTSTIQMTDVAGDSVVSPEESRFCDNSINPDDIFDGSTFVVGRPLEAILDMIQEGLDHITAYLTDLATCSRQPPLQILDHFLKQYTRLNPANDWNQYSKYFSHYTEQELECLQKSGSFTGTVDGTPSATTCKKCYELFKKEYCDTWQEILIKFKESMQYTKTGKTVAQWQQLSPVCHHSCYILVTKM
ncbi:hypothetical protein BKA83DRAFT_4497416 [Pisolithus microcarpus]|nr:hypothetical protein BKA83DRAFT_4497416 [Pisolithus microcarpus]